MFDKKVILVTGAAGMIGTYLVKSLVTANFSVIGIDAKESDYFHGNYTHIKADLEDRSGLELIINNYKPDRIVHLAALAHAFGNKNITYQDYYNANVKCAENIFLESACRNIPILFISTTDVYGFTDGIADVNTPAKPVSNYAKTKALAEEKLASICKQQNNKYNIFRLSPVYTDDVKRDIQKRYYLKYPDLAYIVGKGTDYEFLYIDTLLNKIDKWVKNEPDNMIYNIKDEKMVNTAECIKNEKENGRAKFVLYLPKWIVSSMFWAIIKISGKNKYTYLLNKAVNPLRTN